MADHFDAEIACEERYCDYYPTWDEMVEEANNNLLELTERENIEV